MLAYYLPSMKIDSLSVFFPAYNEEKNIAVTVTYAIRVLKDLKIPQWEILIIDDGSKDKTGQIADDLAKKYSNIKAIHQINGGYGMALRTGFANAKYDLVAYTDSDGQFDFSEITNFFDKLDEADVIYGYRIKRNDPIHRIIFGKGWILSLWLLFGLNLNDVDCGFKLIKRKVLDNIPPFQSKRGGMINAELAIQARRAGFRISQVGVHHFPRLGGKPTGASIKVIFKSYLDLFKLRWKLLL